jgi:hypothetical protein
MGTEGSRLCAKCFEWTLTREKHDQLMQEQARAFQAEHQRLRQHVVSLEIENQALNRRPVNADSTPSVAAITSDRWKQLIKLVHPDKHDGSRAATEATQYLLSLRPTKQRSADR